MPSHLTDISIVGAREHNLKNVSVDIPRGKFVVVTGVSGSGKSTLAFDLVFSEGQRRFLDSMSAYARQFVEQMARPDVDLISGIPPTVSIEQRVTRGGGKSTVATVTEVYHYLRLLFARLGVQHCPACDVPVEALSRDEVGKRLLEQLNKRGDLLLLSPVVRNRKGFHSEVAEWAAKRGYAEVRADGKMYSTKKKFKLSRFKEHDVEIAVGVVERGPKKLKSLPSDAQFLVDEALKIGGGTVYALDNDGVETTHSTERTCPGCDRSFNELEPKMFSYNSSRGWCSECRGFGELFYLPEVDRGARAEAIEESWYSWQEGSRDQCPSCHGARLNEVSRAVKLVGFKSTAKGIETTPRIGEFSNATVEQASDYFSALKVAGRNKAVAKDVLPEITERLKFLKEVGLGYMQLGRSATTLSGGEAQRIRLAAQLGSNLSGVLYVLDEPTIGLHARDNERLIHALEMLRERGNSLLLVEHDEDTMRHADHIIDLGPGAGVHGGEIVAQGNLTQLKKNKSSITGKFLRTKVEYPSRGERRKVKPLFNAKGRKLKSALPDEWMTLSGATLHNLKQPTVGIPLNRFVTVTGVSGSGKSTLIRECLLPLIAAQVKKEAETPSAEVGTLDGWKPVHAVYEVDQSPIGRTPRSVPATYVGFFDDIRKIFSQLPEARMRGYAPGRFSFNSKLGRCQECEGSGSIKLEMNFLPPAFVTCETCEGKRFNQETLDIELSGKNITEVLDMSVTEACEFFSSFPRIKRALEALSDTGLGYVRLGQSSPTLSGGEAQRLKLVTHLLGGLKNAPEKATRPHQHKLFILEEPTIGLHMSDVARLVDVIQRLVDGGHSVVVIEHNMDLIAESDWLIDLGPEGGQAGGSIVVEGTPEQVATCKKSYTGVFLQKHMEEMSGR